MNFLVASPSRVLRWLNAKGYYGTLYDAFNQYVRDGSYSGDGTLYDHLEYRLGQSGYTGTIDDMLNTMFLDKTGDIYRYDAERRFFDDDSLDMFTGAVPPSGITDDDGNVITDDDGNIIMDGS